MGMGILLGCSHQRPTIRLWRGETSGSIKAAGPQGSELTIVRIIARGDVYQDPVGLHNHSAELCNMEDLDTGKFGSLGGLRLGKFGTVGA